MSYQKNLELCADAIKSARTIAVAGHINPDGDCIGSLLSLGLGCRKLQKTVYMISADRIPSRYLKLPGAGDIISYTGKICDLAIAVDCSTKELLGKAYKVFEKARTIIEIDHHDYRNAFGDIAFVDSKACAVGQIIYELLLKLGVEPDKKIAQNILTSIIVETNSFRLPTVDAQTFKICAELLRTGLDYHSLTEMVYWSQSKGSISLKGICFSRLKFLKGAKIVWSLVRRQDLKATGSKEEDADPFANDMLSIRGVRLAVFFRQSKNGLLRVSLRSKGSINVARFAQKYKGGGHSDAAGCFINDDDESLAKFLKNIERVV